MQKLIILLILFLTKSTFSQQNEFTHLQIKADLEYLQKALISKHPNLFVYSTPTDFKQFFEEIEIPKKATEIEVYSLISSTSSIIKDGHTLFHPRSGLISKNNENQLFFPLEVFWDGSELFIRKNHSSNQEVFQRAKITSINGLNSQIIIANMLERMMRDGNNFSYANWVINNYFFEYFSYFHGCPDEFELTISGIEQTITVKGLKKSDLLKAIKSSKEAENKAITLEFSLEKNLAILTIKDWHNDVLRKYYQQNFKKEIVKIFDQIAKNNIENLIIDVRNNQGGNPQNSRLLLSYLLNEPFQLVHKYYKIKKGNLKEIKGPQMGFHKPQKTVFEGNLFVLINGGSFSNTGIFCSVLKKFNRATFIGTETGGSEYVICGNVQNVILPNSKIQVAIPTLQFLIKEYSKGYLSGVKPDHEIKPTVESLISDKDLEKEFAIKLIKESKSEKE